MIVLNLFTSETLSNLLLLFIPGSALAITGIVAASSAASYLTFYMVHKKGLGIRRKKHRSFLTGVENHLQILIDNLPDCVFIKDMNFKYVVANKRFAKYNKLDSVDALLGKTDSEIYDKKKAEEYNAEDKRIISGEETCIQHEQPITIDGKKRFTTVTKFPLLNSKGKISGIIGVLRDITEQYQAQKELEDKNTELENERNLLRTLMDNMPDTIYIKDRECRFLDVNPTQIKVTKAKSKKDMMGKTDYDFYPKDMADLFYKDDKSIIKSGKPVINKEEIGFDEEGNIRIKSTTKVPFEDENGNVIGLVGIGRDITEQKEAQEKLKEQSQSLQEINVLLEERQEEINQQSEELSKQNKILESERNLLRTLIDNIPDIIYLKNKNAKYVTANKRLMQIVNVDNLDKIIDKDELEFFPKDYASSSLDDDKSIIRSGKAIIDKEEPGVGEDGKLIHLLTSKVPLRNEEGEVDGIISICRDITNIKEAELKLKEQASSLKEVNVLLEERQEEIQQQSDELARRNNALENEKNLLRTLIDNIPDFIYIKDSESRFITANKRVIDVMSAKSIDNLIGKTDYDFYPKDMADIFYNDERTVISTGKPVINKEERGYDEKSNERIISTSKVPYKDADGKVIGIVGIGRDITEIQEAHMKLKKQAEDLKEINVLLEERQEEIQQQSDELSNQNKILEQERSLLRTLIDNMPDYIYIKDRESRFLTANKRLAEVMHVKSLDEIIGKTDLDFATTPESAQQYYADERNIIKTGKPIINKEEIGFDENDKEKYISTTKVPFRDADGNIAGIVGIGRDITKQKNSEKKLREQAESLQEVNILLEERQEKIQQQSEELNKQAEYLKKANVQLEQLNATKNKFFSIIAHDLKNPFQAIFGFSELLIRNYDDFDEPQKMELMGMIKTSSESAFNLLENLLQWARTQTDRIKYSPVSIDMKEIIEQNIELSRAAADNKNIEISCDVKGKAEAFADKNMINLVVRNLVSNAIKFTDQDGQIILKCIDTGDNDVAISISDTGIGISKENVKKLFRIDEYFSTSGTSGEAGTGLGLIICKEFVEKNKGEIKIESELEKGTTFTFTLPKSAKK